MMKMTKKTIMLSAVALIAANALTFGPVSYKVSAADPAVVSSVATSSDKLNKVYTQLNNDPVLLPLVTKGFTEVNNYVNQDTFDATALLPNLWSGISVNLDPAEKIAFKNELTKVIRLALVEFDPTKAPVTDISADLEQSLTNLSDLLDSKDYPRVNKTQLADFILELEAAALAKINGTELAPTTDLGELVSIELDALIQGLWNSSSSQVVVLLKALYNEDLELLVKDVKKAQEILSADAFSPNTAKQASAALGIAYVKAQLVGKSPLGNATAVNNKEHKISQLNILGIKGFPLSAFDFSTTDLVNPEFDTTNGYLKITSDTSINSSKTIEVTAKLANDNLIPQWLHGATVFTQTVTLSPKSNAGGGEFIDTELSLVPNATTIAQNISDKIDAALVGIGELTTNKDIFALRAIVEEELRSALTVNAGSKVTTNNGVSELKLTAADLSSVFSQLDSVIKTANAALQAVVADAEPVKPVLNLSVGNLDSVKVVINGELLGSLKAKGIYAIGVTSNGALIEVPLTELEANSSLQITKTNGITAELKDGMNQVSALTAKGIQAIGVTGITPELKDGMKQVSDIYNVVVIGADGKEKHEFQSQARIVLPVNSGSVGNEQFLTLAKIEGSKLINLGGTYNPAKKQFSAMRNTFSSYVVIENPVAFKDTSELAWAEDDILKAAAKGIIVGRAEGVFAPRAEITRAEFTALLVRTLGIEAVSYTETFTDVNDGDWYQSVVATAAAYGIINGRTSTTFDPDAPITRSEMATITSNVLVKVLGYKPVSDVNDTLNLFADQADVVPAHRAGVALVAQEGIVQGKGLGVYDPKGTFTRAEAAVVINKLLNLR
ncbi:S-layer homology domain-containing protein [Paenibacillus endoradicis]|uniref:S-layer homology domain-containing protein n=1 Tax=Paenibacillus endoradicis TaxID=2972487 RepID=UPI002159B3BC|nr:S-layer homology domain-containing protein [Paenibacillus endoradicis]MCR8660650.1 S-layer homology domain-containing protein [Paenibacillus endoradicis]